MLLIDLRTLLCLFPFFSLDVSWRAQANAGSRKESSISGMSDVASRRLLNFVLSLSMVVRIRRTGKKGLSTCALKCEQWGKKKKNT